MTTKIFKGVFFVALAVLLASAGIIFVSTYNGYNSLALDDARRECKYVKAGIEEYGTEYLIDLDIDGVRITHVAEDGRVLYESDPSVDASGAENHLDREEIREALKSGKGSATRNSKTFGRQTVYYAMRLSDGSVIRVAQNHYSAFNIFTSVIQPAIFLFLAVLLFAFIVAYRLCRSIVKPINELDLDHPDEEKVYGELFPIIKRLKVQNYKIQKQMKELSARQTEFNSITAGMSEGIVIINSRASILSCNNSARSILGIGQLEESRSILSVNGSDGLRAAIIKALSGENGSHVIRAENKVYSLLVTPVKRDDKVDGAVIFIIDVTEKDSRDQLRREFTANVSHELKTPLTSISGFAELIKDGIADGEDARRFAGNIHSEAKRLINLVGDIIRLNQVDGGEIPYDGEINLLDVVREVKEWLTPVADGKGVTIDAECEAAMVLGNRQILEEMIYNLVDNGIKYNDKSGGYVRVVLKKTDTGAILSVSDNGIGIPKSEQDRVFERFYRVDKSHSREIGGTGLGLSIVKHAATYHKAELSLESEPGVGTTVRLVFPVTDSSAVAETGEKAAEI